MMNQIKYLIRECEMYGKKGVGHTESVGSLGLDFPFICDLNEPCKYGNRNETTKICKTQGKIKEECLETKTKDVA